LMSVYRRVKNVATAGALGSDLAVAAT